MSSLLDRSNKKGCETTSFHGLPISDSKLLRQWIIKARPPQKLINRHSRISSAHFPGGKRSDINNVLQQFPRTSRRKPPEHPSSPVTSIRKPPPSRERPSSPVLYLSLVLPSSSILPPAPVHHNSILEVDHDHTYSKSRQQGTLSTVGTDEVVVLTANGASDKTGRMDVATQCATNLYTSSSVQCSSSLLEKSLEVSRFYDDNAAIHLYTGLPDYRTFNACFEFLGDAVNNLNYWYGGKTSPNNRGAPRALTPLNEFFIVLCRLRLGLLEQDLAYRFHVSQTTISRICVTWINFLYMKLSYLANKNTH